MGNRLVEVLGSSGYSGFSVSRQQFVASAEGWRWKARRDILRDGPQGGPISALLHLEVKHHVPTPREADLRAFDEVNVGGTQLWLDWCTRFGVSRFVYFSTIKAVVADANGVADENAPTNRGSPYGESKAAAEQLVRAWVAEDRRRSALILRPAVVYGPGNVANVAAMVRAIDRNRFVLIGANCNVKSMVSVGNVAAAVVHLLPRMQPGACEVFNLVDAESYSVRQIDGMIRRSLGKEGNSPTLPVAVARAAAKFGDVFHRLSGGSFPINSTRLNALLENTHFSGEKLLRSGFKHPQSTEEGIAEMVAWCKSGVPLV